MDVNDGNAAQEVHAAVRKWLAEKAGPTVAAETRWDDDHEDHYHDYDVDHVEDDDDDKYDDTLLQDPVWRFCVSSQLQGARCLSWYWW